MTKVSNPTNIIRVQTVISAAQVTPNANTKDEVVITAQSSVVALLNPSGSPKQGQAMIIRIKDDGNAQIITYDAQYRAVGIVLPNTTVVSKTTYIGMVFNSNDNKWDCISTVTEG